MLSLNPETNNNADRHSSQVYIPLSISLGIAADATPEAGLITATWAVLAAGLVGGSHHNIVGPTGDFSKKVQASKKTNQNRHVFMQVL